MARKIDENQNEVVKTLRKLGAIVYITSDLGKGFPDLLVKVRNKLFLLEIKNGKLPPSKQRLTPHEKVFHDAWGDTVYIIRSIDEAIDFVNSTARSG